MMLCSITAAALATSFCFYSFIVGSGNRVLLPWKYFATVPSIIDAAVDLASSVSLIVLLSGAQSGYKIRHTQHIVKRIVLFTMTRGVLLTMVQIAYTVSYYVLPGGGIWNAFLVIIARLYTNNLLAMLNYRESMKSGVGIVAVSLSTSGTSNAHGSNGVGHQSGLVFTPVGVESSIEESVSVQFSNPDHRDHYKRYEEPVALEQFKY